MPLLNLPTELLSRIVAYVDWESLHPLRLTCQTLSHIAVNQLFKTVELYPDQDSCNRFTSILRCNLKNRTKRIILHSIEADAVTDGEEAQLPGYYTALIPRLDEFPNLHSLTVHFDKYCCVPDENGYVNCSQTWNFRSDVMKRLFASTASLPRLNQELAIRHMQTINVKDVKTLQSMDKTLRGLRSLRLGIISEYDNTNPEITDRLPEPHDFFDEIPPLWLKPTMSTLQHLTLYYQHCFGFYPKLDLRGVHFPHLKTLALGNYTFIHDTQLDWILSHGHSLCELYLDECAIVFAARMTEPETVQHCYLDSTQITRLSNEYHATYSARWHDYFSAFQSELPHLRHISMGRSDWWLGMPFEMEGEIGMGLLMDRYMMFDDETRPNPYIGGSHVFEGEYEEWPSCTEEDKEALGSLLISTGQMKEDIIVE
ncbi:hypothetical protein ASPWEDRAFT_117384 [Aspergillus wentii DTO 134E9]|uniref:F-box domain-containing protein n=1 Tax=Aspergillus wentii DTO 134E9 TaxID=1073089 RepID=A0A1L9R776_ASPWE|nr:uncharacterized protein ASPWEDRAFT_118569 [Aspergillus wentii DTO 134E9]XP_040685383.1 uncharacterized protein ASPWEDRAFT_117384 [Aspergillus wentii DTO 134E9]OJJ30775.1 hypothetical protein ASPWEDRAFT_118569 [Aspergillus wentii DTO 134E9]OJJ31706.1 hypothetical protein ASPWEDRAFT_117384 [Aspergillus wentii DTO 134E9]